MRTNSGRLLPALMLMVAIVSTPSVMLAQSPGSPSPNAPSPNAPSPQATQTPTTAPAQALSQPAVEPTPEQMGDSMMAHQRYQAAIAAYKNAPPKDAEVWNKMGIAYQLMFNLTDAMHCYRTSNKLNPNNGNVLNNLGTVYDAMKQYHSAEKMYRKAVKIDPQSALILKNLGTNLLAQHEYAKGWQEYQAALKLDPNIFEENSRPRIENPASVSDRGAMNYYMARGCAKAGMPQQAIEYLRMALNEGYTNPKKIIADNEFANLHGVPAFEELLTSQTQKRQ
jgi:tetratricopeptide (TPR) repeat protein